MPHIYWGSIMFLPYTAVGYSGEATEVSEVLPRNLLEVLLARSEARRRVDFDHLQAIIMGNLLLI